MLYLQMQLIVQTYLHHRNNITFDNILILKTFFFIYNIAQYLLYFILIK